MQQRRLLVQLTIPSPAASPRFSLVLVQHPQRPLDPSGCRHQRLGAPWDDQERPFTATICYRSNQLLRVAAGSLRDTTRQRFCQPTHRWVIWYLHLKMKSQSLATQRTAINQSDFFFSPFAPSCNFLVSKWIFKTCGQNYRSAQGCTRFVCQISSQTKSVLIKMHWTDGRNL